MNDVILVNAVIDLPFLHSSSGALTTSDKITFSLPYLFLQIKNIACMHPYFFRNLVWIFPGDFFSKVLK